jgi:hypothetical protein
MGEKTWSFLVIEDNVLKGVLERDARKIVLKTKLQRYLCSCARCYYG